MNDKPIEISFRSPHSLLAVAMGANAAIFYSSYNINDISFAVLVVNILLMGIFNFLVVNFLAIILNRFVKRNCKQILMAAMFVFYAHYMGVAFFRNGTIRAYFATPLENLIPHSPLIILLASVGFLGFILADRAKKNHRDDGSLVLVTPVSSG